MKTKLNLKKSTRAPAEEKRTPATQPASIPTTDAAPPHATYDAPPGTHVHVLALDPGNTETGYVVWDGEKILMAGKFDNEIMRRIVARLAADEETTHLAIETIVHVHKGAGVEVMHTADWTGRFHEVWEMMKTDDKPSAIRISRVKAASYVCGTNATNDAAVLKALKKRFGNLAITGDCWAALAVGVCAFESLVKAGPHATFELTEPAKRKPKKKTPAPAAAKKSTRKR